MRNGRFPILMLSLVLVAPLMAGCTSGDDKDAGAPQLIGFDPNAGRPAPKNITLSPDLADAPSAHFHHYWGDPPLQNVTIFGEITGAGSPVLLSEPDFEYFNFGSLYGAEFNLETDGDDVTRTDDPIMEGKADTVFVGTKEIRVTIDWTSSFVDRVFFQWKPANTNKYSPEASGVEFTPGAKFIVPLDDLGAADPPHQFAVSRWSFRVWADSQTVDDLGPGLNLTPTAVVEPEFEILVNMVAVNGGESALDPPHPNFWVRSDEISLGVLGERTVDEPAVMTPAARLEDPRMKDISFPPGSIVPLGTEKVTVKLKYTTTYPPVEPDGFSLGLAFHGADTLAYTHLGPPTSTDGDWLVWEILTYDPEDPEAEIRVDPPYELSSFWRFELVPMLNDGSDPDGLDGANTQRYVLGWAGSYEMEFSATKIPGFELV